MIMHYVLCVFILSVYTACSVVLAEVGKGGVGGVGGSATSRLVVDFTPTAIIFPSADERAKETHISTTNQLEAQRESSQVLTEDHATHNSQEREGGADGAHAKPAPGREREVPPEERPSGEAPVISQPAPQAGSENDPPSPPAGAADGSSTTANGPQNGTNDGSKTDEGAAEEEGAAQPSPSSPTASEAESVGGDNNANTGSVGTPSESESTSNPSNAISADTTTTTTTTTLPPELTNNKKGDADSSSSISSSVWVRVPLLIVVTLACILVC